MKVSVSCIVRCDDIVRCLPRLSGTVHNPSNDFCAVVVVVIGVVVVVAAVRCFFAVSNVAVRSSSGCSND